MICASVGNLPLSEILQIVSSEDLVELRFDLLPEEIGHYREAFGKRASIIVTCRPGSIPEEKRKRIYTSAINWGAAFIDVELDMPEPFFGKLKSQSRRNDVNIIGSFHDYSDMPSSSALEELVHRGNARGCDLVKIVAAAETTDDAIKLISLLSLSDNVIIAATGKFSKLVRFAAPLIGAKITYGAATLSAPTANNQPTVHELRDMFKLWEEA